MIDKSLQHLHDVFAPRTFVEFLDYAERVMLRGGREQKVKVLGQLNSMWHTAKDDEIAGAKKELLDAIQEWRKKVS